MQWHSPGGGNALSHGMGASPCLAPTHARGKQSLSQAQSVGRVQNASSAVGGARGGSGAGCSTWGGGVLLGCGVGEQAHSSANRTKSFIDTPQLEHSLHRLTRRAAPDNPLVGDVALPPRASSAAQRRDGRSTVFGFEDAGSGDEDLGAGFGKPVDIVQFDPTVDLHQGG